MYIAFSILWKVHQDCEQPQVKLHDNKIIISSVYTLILGQAQHYMVMHSCPAISQKYYLDVIKQTIDDSNIVTYLSWSLQHIST